MAEAAPRQQQATWPQPQQGRLSPTEDIKGVHWAHGYRRLPVSKSEQRSRYTPHENASPSQTEVPSHLRETHWDLAFGCEKSARDWQSVLTEQLASNVESKFGCEKPRGMEAIASELRKSNIALSCGNLVAYQSEQHGRYIPPNSRPAECYSKTLGRDLRSSHVDLSNGAAKTGKNWQTIEKGEMARHSREKYHCEKPRGFDSREMRKSAVPLGGLNWPRCTK